MRQLTVLVVGLVLIFSGAGLIRVLRHQYQVVQAGASSPGFVADRLDVPAAPSQLPAAGADVTQLPSRRPVALRSVPNQRKHSDTGVSPASFRPFQGLTADTLKNLTDSNNETWSEDKLLEYRETTFVSGTLTIDPKDVYTKDGQPADLTTIGEHVIVALDATATTATERAAAWESANQAGNTYTINVAKQNSGDEILQVAAGAGPLQKVIEHSLRLPVNNRKTPIRLKMHTTDERYFVLSKKTDSTATEEFIVESVVLARASGSDATYRLDVPLSLADTVYRITPFRRTGQTVLHGQPISIKFLTAATKPAVEFAAANLKAKSGQGIQLNITARPDAQEGLPYHAVVQAVGRVTQTTIIPLPADPKTGSVAVNFDLPDGTYNLSARLFSGVVDIESTATAKLDVVSSFEVVRFGPTGFGTYITDGKIEITLDRPLAAASATTENFKAAIDVSGPDSGLVYTVVHTAGKIAITITSTISRGQYTVTLDGSKLLDEFGNPLKGNSDVAGEKYSFVLGSSTAIQGQQLVRGVSRSGGKQVEYPAILPAGAPDPVGFNPNDRVETRVARLYFFRDAHRVAQIINRMVESHNKQGVSNSQQLAMQARREAEDAATERMEAERKAIEAAKVTRQIERDLAAAQSSYDRSLQELERAAVRSNNSAGAVAQAAEGEQRRAAEEIARNDALIVSRLEDSARTFGAQVEELQDQLRSLQVAESEANEQTQQRQRTEDLAHVRQFQLEAALGHTDPDTYAAGKIESVDPVAQVSITVMGEGLLHLRGPLRGLNKVRTMIDQIDAPQGQVAVKVHTAQINGDEADHLEIVANRIQTYIDQARFLTTQSAEMLRKSVTIVAARRAEAARAIYPADTQADRDMRYLDAFFGADFINELHTADSELLRTGNKLLSLHSMDSTSLSHALLLIALAKNSARIEILEEFQRQLQENLPLAEAQYISNGIGCCTGGCKQGCKHHNAAPPICQLSQNATFPSLLGFFNTELPLDDTMTPIQREIIKLAQILRARLISEKELKQRVNNRSVIESRIARTSNREDLRFQLEQNAQRDIYKALAAHQAAHAQLGAKIPRISAELDYVRRGVEGMQPLVYRLTEMLASLIKPDSIDSGNSLDVSLKRLDYGLEIIRRYRRDRAARFSTLDAGSVVDISSDKPLPGSTRPLLLLAFKPPNLTPSADPDDYIYLGGRVAEAEGVAILLRQIAGQAEPLVAKSSVTQDSLNRISQILSIVNDRMDKLNSSATPHSLRSSDLEQLANQGMKALVTIEDLRLILENLKAILTRFDEDLKTLKELAQTQDRLFTAFNCLSENAYHGSVTLADIRGMFKEWNAYNQAISRIYDGQIPEVVDGPKRDIGGALEELSTAFSRMTAARAMANQAKQPLDHKKFLDMFIDEEEEQLIELLEGTRAHTANIDNYLKRITSALDDDFNTQFYHPALRMVRQASQYKRVEFGQTETTGVLANNRSFAKVSPSATMEFDLPERDILLKEAVDGVLATYNDFGALLNDPNMLAMLKMQSGGVAGGAIDGFGVVQNVIPGLQSDSTNQVISRQAGNSPGFGSNLEKLIKDPAIYKFETGTGYEIRPVIAPDGQAVVFDFHYLYTTQIREPVRADEKHLGRVKRHLIDTDVQLSNFELREVSRYTVALKAERTAKGVPLLEDIPLVGVLWRPLPNREKSLQQNIILSQATIFPTLYDLMNLRWAPEVADLDPLLLSEREFVNDQRRRHVQQYIDGFTASHVDDALGIPQNKRREDLYSVQAPISRQHPNNYSGPGMNYRYAPMQEGYTPQAQPPGGVQLRSPEGSSLRQPRRQLPSGIQRPVPAAPAGGIDSYPPHEGAAYPSLPRMSGSNQREIIERPQASPGAHGSVPGYLPTPSGTPTNAIRSQPTSVFPQVPPLELAPAGGQSSWQSGRMVSPLPVGIAPRNDLPTNLPVLKRQ